MEQIFSTTSEIERREIASMYSDLADELGSYIAEKYPQGCPPEDKRTFWQKVCDTLFYTYK